jgi:hypothetical protein
MLAEYTGVLVVLIIGVVLVCALLGIHLLLGPRRQFAEPSSAGNARSRHRTSATP